jgi:hypothetical protein
MKTWPVSALPLGFFEYELTPLLILSEVSLSSQQSHLSFAAYDDLDPESSTTSGDRPTTNPWRVWLPIKSNAYFACKAMPRSKTDLRRPSVAYYLHRIFNAVKQLLNIGSCLSINMNASLKELDERQSEDELNQEYFKD